MDTSCAAVTKPDGLSTAGRDVLQPAFSFGLVLVSAALKTLSQSCAALD
ncbi:MAG: hypothetical protein VX223_09750 [Myxococcota bacterium]|nr:hypothetical protein [Myxococcota bacterium]